MTKRQLVTADYSCVWDAPFICSHDQDLIAIAVFNLTDTCISLLVSKTKNHRAIG